GSAGAPARSVALWDMRQTTMRTTTRATARTTSRATGAAPAAVSFRHTAKSFGPVRAVTGLDLDIPRGETVALLGRNGAGKSTAISLLLGLDEPDAGTVRLFGESPERAVRSG